MSRYTFKPDNDTHVSYGYDHACGYFIQVYERNEDEPVLDVDSLFGGLTGVRLAQLLAEYNVVSFESMKHKQLMMLDLPF